MGFWEVQVWRYLKDEEVDSYLSLLELLQEVSVDRLKRDEIVWCPNQAVGFSVHGGYSWVRRNLASLDSTARKYKEVWGCHIPLKVKAFMWTVYLDKVLTKVRLAQWYPNLDATCVFCSMEAESMEHLFIKCPMAKTIWGWLEAAYGLNTNFSNLEGLWLSGKALKNPGDQSIKAKVSQIVIPAVLWAIWHMRTNVIFNGARPYAENAGECVGGEKYMAKTSGRWTWVAFQDAREANIGSIA
ncbi:hypothetical protein QJS10_CPB13g01245 [Acorus calamus]|uniref:Reverse transcriptase zinc-binding domain-containing protein n=1 Tax=Acorus calamus TaxID=4465 RepID=A0AAV9DI71_ACOCL|nr:hypothetical protein QJS10_CPB13g01245 [Acorus calamus]